jgi:E3 ubiquitin-protein ligase DOA10
MAEPRASEGPRDFGIAWVFLCLAFVAHVVDEASTGFLEVYNPTVLAVRAQSSWFPMPTFEYREWLFGLIVANFVCLLLTPFAFRNARWLRPLAYFFAGIMFLNGCGHTVATILGRTVSSVHFPRPAPGFYSSPFLLAGSIFLIFRLRSSADAASGETTHR